METENFIFLFQAGPIESDDVRAFRIARTLGQVAEAEVDVYFAAQVEPDDLLGCSAHLALGRGVLEHAFDGVVMGVTLSATPLDGNARGCVHRLHLTSLMGLLE